MGANVIICIHTVPVPIDEDTDLGNSNEYTKEHVPCFM